MAELQHEAPSVGTIGEIVYAATLGKPVIAWGNAGYASSPWIEEHVVRRFGKLDDALAYIIAMYCQDVKIITQE